MASPIEEPRTHAQVLNTVERWAFFDEQARALMGMSGDEFLRRWDAGEFEACADDPEHPEIMHLALLIPFGR
jgi:hypothetical protein